MSSHEIGVLLERLFNFDDRAPRKEFWTITIGLYLFTFMVFIAVFLVTSGSLVGLLLGGLLTMVPHLAVAIRRYHDRNKSAWWVLISMIPYVGFIWMMIELGFLKGTDGPNRYGEV